MRQNNKATPLAFACALCIFAGLNLQAQRPLAPVVDSGQQQCYNTLKPMAAPRDGAPLHGQDAQYQGLQPTYTDNGNGTISDLNTGLIWSQACDAKKVTLKEAQAIAPKMTLGGHNDWRVPTVKELYSLIDFRGVTGMAGRDMSKVPDNAIPYINTDYFEFRYGDVDSGERFIDAQWLTSTVNVSPIMNGQTGLFGVNFADGRIKCYPIGKGRRGTEKTYYARYVRGNADYGQNQFVDNGDGTITDSSTGLTWMQADSGKGMNWKEALEYAESLEHAGHTDWRLPNAKELQSLIDYSRSPDKTKSPAIDPHFDTTTIQNEAGKTDYPYFWTSTTHLDGPNARQAVYVSFGRAIGQMRDRILDVHGAGAQRSDPKEGSARLGHGPQGDAQRVLNYVRAVRGGAIKVALTSEPVDKDAYPNRIQLPDTSYTPKKMTFKNTPQGGPPSERRQSKGHRPPPRL